MIARVTLRIAVAALLVAAFVAAYFFWFRDSSLVAVDQVKVEGVPEATAEGPAIREALVAAGREMTTLNLDRARLREAVASFPEVRSLEADTGFPDSLTVTVSIRQPVAKIAGADKEVGVAGDGVILPSASVTDRPLPLLPVSEPPKSGQVAGPVLDQVRVLAGAPPEMLAVSAAISRSDEHGPVVTLVSGVELRFGDASRVKEKWRSAVAVLNDPGLELLDYVDLSSPGRPATGGTAHSLPPLP